jgi:hypothetical protein
MMSYGGNEKNLGQVEKAVLRKQETEKNQGNRRRKSIASRWNRSTRDEALGPEKRPVDGMSEIRGRAGGDRKLKGSLCTGPCKNLGLGLRQKVNEAEEWRRSALATFQQDNLGRFREIIKSKL